jgi:hypothetical protein
VVGSIAFFGSVTYLCRVKYLSLVLALLVLLVSAAPCCPDDCGQSDDSIAQTNHQSDSHPEGDGGKACSPFLTCGFCFGFVKPLSAPALPPGFMTYQREFADTYHFSCYPLVSSSFWQQPKIG